LYNSAYEHGACGIGFVVNIKGKRSNKILTQGLEALVCLDHRGARGCELNTGDGAGILLQLPHVFLRQACKGIGIDLPQEGYYGVGMVFFSKVVQENNNKTLLTKCKQEFERIASEEGQKVLGWRAVPTNDSSLGPTAKSSEPEIWQVFIARGNDTRDSAAFERKLYVIRKRVSKTIRYGCMDEKFYIASLSSRTIVYKGMLTPAQVKEFYLDLRDPLMETAIVLFHSRFSTNTFPSWERAHPYRYVIHNGEINTLRGNKNWMRTREAMLSSELFGSDLAKVFPVLDEDGSDSAIFDNCLEFLHLSGRSLPHSIMMMIPEPWEKNQDMPQDIRAFYQYHSSLMEPWDGPAHIAFTDGTIVGACLDRNGFRPSRYYITKDDNIVLASEAGVLDIPPEEIAQKRRLKPGTILLIDTSEGRIISDQDIKKKIASEHPYQKWLDQNLVSLEELPSIETGMRQKTPDHESILRRQQAFGYTYEDLKIFIAPMSRVGRDPVGSMGQDAPLAVLSRKQHLLYDYFHQLFAQVTNPPLDPLKEEVITSSETTIGPERNLLKPEPESCRQIRIKTPILTDEELERLRKIDHPGFRVATIPILFDAVRAKSDPAGALENAMQEVFDSADRSIGDGHNIIILSDRGVDRGHAPIPALLAVSGLHHHLIKNGSRTKVGMILESGEPREVHHFCLLLGYGAQAVNPYMAFESLRDMIEQGQLTEISFEDAAHGYVHSVTKGVVKVMSKMGISTIKSYRGAQVFEAVGIKKSLVDKYFCWTDSRIEGIGLEVIAREALMRHHAAFTEQALGPTLDQGGLYQWRDGGEYHLNNPLTIHKLQLAARTNSYRLYKEYANLIDNDPKNLSTLRGLLEFNLANSKPIPIEEVEPVDEICKRFKSGAMSYGSISKEAHEALAIAMNRLGGRSNTGEGGEDPARYVRESNGDSKNSAIKQVASGRFGVTSYYLVNARELQIKIAQGAKPGEGGELPGHKVYPWIAKVRHATPGVELISPPPHHDIYSIEDLAQLIYDLKCANHYARISVKLVSEVGVGTIAAGVAKGHADVVLISGHDGGTGASPQTSIKHAGLPWELGLAETHQTLLLNNLRSRIVVEVDGQLKSGRDVVIAALLGAEEFGFATSTLIVMGCVMMRACHLDTCPVGIATQNPELRKKFTGDPSHVVNFLRFVAQDMREIMAQLGVRTVAELVGRTELLKQKQSIDHWKAGGIDLSAVLHQPQVSPDVGRYCQTSQNHGVDVGLDNEILFLEAYPALHDAEKVHANVPITNADRAVGTMLGSEATRRYGREGLPEDAIDFHFKGSAGQSFGAFIPKGITFRLEGDANDYIGKGLSGGKIIVYPPEEATFEPEKNIIVGNVAFYGATSGEAYIRGEAGERFCVRNSGVNAVVEGVGDHACEYMTGGRVVVLGKTGRNFAAGMSGGIAYVLDLSGDFYKVCNQELVSLEQLTDPAEIAQVKSMINKHTKYTRSTVGEEVLTNWEKIATKFVRVMPKDYKLVLDIITLVEKEGLKDDEAWLEAFRRHISPQLTA
jgi:glutamate synthase (NADPH/NADH) large chain